MLLQAILQALMVRRSLGQLSTTERDGFRRNVSQDLFLELEELSRLAGIAYCVGNTGIQRPFACLNRCSDFPHVELVKTFDAGLIDPQACGYIALSHPPSPKRIIVAFRGTQSLSDAISDMMSMPSEYLAYPLDDASCNDCRVHAGFMASWVAVRASLGSTIADLVKYYPDHELVLLGHSLGGAMAGLAGLEFRRRGWDPKITTFGEPRFGNAEMARHVDAVFPWNVSEAGARYRRVTHVNDPVPLLPYTEWGWRMHGGEIFIAKKDLPPEVADLQRCAGDADPRCISGSEGAVVAAAHASRGADTLHAQELKRQGLIPSIPIRWRVWEILFAHRSYFWKLGMCFDFLARNTTPAVESNLEAHVEL